MYIKSLSKKILSVLFLGAITYGPQVSASFVESIEKYEMKTAQFINGEISFQSEEDFAEILEVGFFRIERPTDIDIGITRKFAREFNNNLMYTTFGSKDPVNGYIESELSQAIRFTLERDFWNTVGWRQEVSLDNPNYPKEIQHIGNQMKDIGIAMLKSILNKFEVPEDLRFKATAGSAYGEGSYFLNFNYYDPNHNPNAEGLGAHRDWSWLTVLDVVEDGLEAEIRGTWMPLELEDGFLTINFGEPLQKFLPGVKACNHRVLNQKIHPRTTTVMFVDPRVGPYRTSAGLPEGEVGMVWDWDPQAKELINGEATVDYFTRLSTVLYGNLNTKTTN